MKLNHVKKTLFSCDPDGAVVSEAEQGLIVLQKCLRYGRCKPESSDDMAELQNPQYRVLFQTFLLF